MYPGGIGWAVDTMCLGQRVYRQGWSAGTWVALSQFTEAAEISKSLGVLVYMRTSAGVLEPWTCSHKDLLANDWELADY